MTTRLRSWSLIGELTFTPDNDETVVGGFSLGPDHDSLWIRVTSLTSPTPWPWSYGILGWRSENGYELGTVKAYSQQLGEVFRLGVGLSPSLRDGQLTFEPRAFNLAWVRQGNPWTLRFEAQSGIGATPPEFPGFGTRATLGVLADSVGAGINYTLSEGLAYLSLP